MTWDSQSFARRLRLARESYRPHGRPWSREKAAVALGFTRNTLDNYERGITSPTIETVARMADYYGVTIGWLVGVTTEGGPSIPPTEIEGGGGASAEHQASHNRYSAVTRPLAGSTK